MYTYSLCLLPLSFDKFALVSHSYTDAQFVIQLSPAIGFQVFSTAGNMEKRITLHIPKEFPTLWAGIGGGLGE